MSTPKPGISRKQAWCKLAILLAEGLPEPQSISFNPKSGTSIHIDVDSVEALNAWIAALGLKIIHTPCLSNDRTEWIHDAWDYWHGWHTRVGTTAPAVDGDPVDEDMAAVRAEAGA